MWYILIMNGESSMKTIDQLGLTDEDLEYGQRVLREIVCSILVVGFCTVAMILTHFWFF